MFTLSDFLDPNGFRQLQYLCAHSPEGGARRYTAEQPQPPPPQPPPADPIPPPIQG
jgi:hypothetical protein